MQRKVQGLLRVVGVAAMVALGALPIIGSAAEAGTPQVRWHTDLVFQSLGVTEQIKDKLGWREVVDRPWSALLGRYVMGGGGFVGSCEQLFDANVRNERISSKDKTQAIDERSYRVRAVGCYAAREIGGATQPHTSYVSGFSMDARNARVLPAGLSVVSSSSEISDVKQAMAKHETLAYVMGRGATFRQVANQFGNAPMVRITNRFGGIEDVVLLARGDFNHDGVEDLLIRTSAISVGGHPGPISLYLVTRLAPKAPMVVLKTYPDLGLGIPLFR